MAPLIVDDHVLPVDNDVTFEFFKYMVTLRVAPPEGTSVKSDTLNPIAFILIEAPPSSELVYTK